MNSIFSSFSLRKRNNNASPWNNMAITLAMVIINLNFIFFYYSFKPEQFLKDFWKTEQ